MEQNGQNLNSLQEKLTYLNHEEKAALLCGLDFWHTQGNTMLHLDQLTLSDGPHGIRYQADQSDHLGLFDSLKATCFPTALALACSWDKHLAFKTGEALGQEAKALGVDVLLGPGLNIIRNPRGGRSFEYYSEDPYLSGKMAGACARGIQEYVSACLKHFALNSQETFRQCVDEQADENTLMDLYLKGFDIAIEEADPDWIMTSYNKVNGEYPSQNKRLLTDLLRNTLHFDGAVMTDWGGSHDIAKGVMAGCNLEMPATFGQSKKELAKPMDQDPELEKAVDLRIAELIHAIEKRKNRTGQKENPAEEISFSDLMEDHDRLAFEAAVSSSVLLKGDLSDIVKDPQNNKLLCVGPFDSDFSLQGAGSSQIKPSVDHLFSYEMFQAGFKHCTWFEGYSLQDADTAIVSTEERAKLNALIDTHQPDAIVFLASLPIKDRMEGADRHKDYLPIKQQELLMECLMKQIPVILVLATPGPVDVDGLELADAILYLGLAGQASPKALAYILAGKKQPGGRLSFTWPKKIADHPSCANFPCKTPVSDHAEKMDVGYLGFQNRNIEPLYGFGYAHLPVRCRIEKIRVNKEGISFHLFNPADQPVESVIQLFVSKDNQCTAFLKGFEKVHLKGKERKEIHILFDRHTFSRWNTKLQEYSSEPGRYKLMLSQQGLDHIDAVRFYNLEETVKETVLKEKNPEEAAAPAEETAVETETAVLEKPALPYKQMEYEPSIDSPMVYMGQSKNSLLKLAGLGIFTLAQNSLKKNKPSTVALALQDMSLNGLNKTSAKIVSSKVIKAIEKWWKKSGSKQG